MKVFGSSYSAPAETCTAGGKHTLGLPETLTGPGPKPSPPPVLSIIGLPLHGSAAFDSEVAPRIRILLIQLQGLHVTALQGAGAAVVHFKNRPHAKLKGAPEAEAAKTDAFRKLEKNSQDCKALGRLGLWDVLGLQGGLSPGIWGLRFQQESSVKDCAGF